MTAVTTALITLSAEGARLLAPLAAALPGARLYIHESVGSELRGGNGRQVGWASGRSASSPERFADRRLTAALFPVCRGLVYAAPAGVVVRAIAPLIRSKYDDPAVVVLDAGGRWAVSLLAGHEGGANALAIRVANILGAEPVVTTTTEALKSVIVGIGCRRGTPAERIVAAVRFGPGGGGRRPRRGPPARLGGSQGGRSRGFSPPRRRSASRSASSPRPRYAPVYGILPIRIW